MFRTLKARIAIAKLRLEDWTLARRADWVHMQMGRTARDTAEHMPSNDVRFQQLCDELESLYEQHLEVKSERKCHEARIRAIKWDAYLRKEGL